MVIDIIKESILQNIGPLKPSSKNWQKRNCPLCHTQGHGRDTRTRFGIQFNAQSIAVNCFNCGFSTSYNEGGTLSKKFKFFLEQINIDTKLISHIEFEIFKNQHKISSIREGEDTSKDLKPFYQKWKNINLPNGTKSIQQWLEEGQSTPDFLQVANYAISRKIYDLDNFYWCPDKSHQLNHRLLIPYKFRNKLVGYTGRLSYKTADKSIPKYYQISPEDFVYNLDSQSKWSRKYTILTEGVIDAWAVDGIATLGEIGQEKIRIINSLQKEIIVCADRDLKGQELVAAAIHNNWSVSFPKWPGYIKDAGQAAETYGRLLTTYSIIESAVRGKDNIWLKWKIEGV
jgi:hypothetical protein